MNRDNINFITQTREERADTVLCLARQLKEIYPKCTFYIYDGGLNSTTQKELNEIDNTKLIPWSDQAEFCPNSTISATAIRKVEKFSKSNAYLKHVLSDLLGYDFKRLEAHKLRRHVFFTKQKPLSILDLSQRVDGNIIWIDDDAIIINKIDELFTLEFDIGVTIRGLYDEIKKQSKPVNSGVLIFNTSSDNIQSFIREWLGIINELEKSRVVEQDAISTMISQNNPSAFSNFYNKSTIMLESEKVEIITLPREKYNYCRPHTQLHPEKNKILHFNAGVCEKDINKELISDIESGNLSKWYRGINQEVNKRLKSDEN